MTTKRWVKLALAAVAVAVPLSAAAATMRIETEIVRTLSADDGTFGGCMALLTVSPVTEGLECGRSSRWVTFDCAGEYVSKSSAARMFDAAQMALMTERPVMVVVDDARQHGGFCLAERIDVLRD